MSGRKKTLEQLRVLMEKAEAEDVSPERRAYHKAAGRAHAESFLHSLALAEEWTEILTGCSAAW